MVNLTITVDQEVLARARARAQREGRSVEDLLREQLIDYAGSVDGRDAMRRLVELGKRCKSRMERGKSTRLRDSIYDQGESGPRTC